MKVCKCIWKNRITAQKRCIDIRWSTESSENNDNLNVCKKLMFNIFGSLIDIKSLRNSENVREKNQTSRTDSCSPISFS